MQILQYSPGQKATLFLETFDAQGMRADGYVAPIVSRIIFPDLSLASDFPQAMSQLDTGLYYFQFTLPVYATSVGSYFVDVSYWDPITDLERQTAYNVIVTAPFGNFGVTNF